jgi:putative ABC transport system ATP-binding protein
VRIRPVFERGGRILSSTSAAVEVDQVVKTFGAADQRVFALRQVNFTAQFGELLMMVGPSGCGKTTLLSAICGTLQIDQGRIRTLGHALDEMKPGELTKFRGENIGFIFQQFNLIPTLTILENASVPLLINGKSRKQAEERAAHYITELGLGNRLRSFPSQLSGGQQQRVAIARALVHEPRLIICDEPTASLDAKSGHKVMELLQETALRADRAVIVVTHDSRILEFADRIAEMEDGNVKGIHAQVKNA